MKTCTKCKIEKSLDEFYKQSSSKDGLTYECKSCKAIYRAKQYKDNSAKAREQAKKWYIENKERHAQSCKAWAKKNKEKVKEAMLRWKKNNPEKVKESNKKMSSERRERRKKESSEWIKNNKKRHLICKKIWRENNKGKSVSYKAKRRAAKLNATPSWANLVAIQCKYQVAAMLSNEGIVKYHVDHIVPLQGKNVCGLHISENLRVIPSVDNLSKGNKFN